MKYNKALLLLACLFALLGAEAQTRYLVKFRNKGFNTHSLANPATYLSQRSIDRRTRYAIAYDSTDLPVTPRYLDSLRSVPNVTILNASKWLNQVSIRTTDAAAIARINAMPFVQSVAAVSARLGVATGSPLRRDKLAQPEGSAVAGRFTGTEAEVYNYGQSANQVRIHNGQFLHNIGLHGEGFVIGMLDAGYQNYLSVPSLDSIRINGQILGVYDFVALDGSVNEDNSHGMNCLSTIAANIPGTFVGTAPEANFYLYRTEDAGSETPIEMHNWVCGAERVDSVGGDLISSSLGYYDFDAPYGSFNHTFSDMNGNTTMPAIGADLAAKKGIMVVNAAGNEGGNSWGRIITPADGDSVLAVGAVNGSGTPASFTSRGPSADGQVKPDLVSVGVGTIIQYPSGFIGGGNGTSFATPNLAGLVTCLWQGFPEYNNMKILEALRRSGHRFNTPNDTVGYGIPDVRLALMNLTTEFSSATALLGNACNTAITWTSKDVSGMRYEIERKIPGQSGFSTVLTQPGSGSVFGAARSYSVTNPVLGVPAGTVTYRIRQVFDTTAANPASAIIDEMTVNVDAACSAAGINGPALDNGSIVLVPNPARNDFSVRVTVRSSFQEVRLQVTDAAGKLVTQRKLSLSAGTTNIPVSVSQFAAGKYFVVLYANGQLLGTRELIKL
ncbi:S8 family peptidase [Flaviaesturariibacter amylovorans]|uniref:T9SS type A sorting domain-containing protein n=1 Tax=Flaviaesturariibacter amylovorans TaxID=1084520 RepID=A0ABP8GG95_9BACT